MDAEEFRLKALEFPDPSHLDLIELVESIVSSERFLKFHDVLKRLNLRPLNGEYQCAIETARERLKDLYDELRSRAWRYGG
jgi:hypothetical protein